MSLNASKVSSGAGKADLLQPENYMARVCQIYDLGLQPQRAYEGKVKPPVQMMRVTYELVTEFMQDENGEDILDKPRWISEKFPLYNLDQEKANSTKRYMGIDPKLEYGGNWPDLLGAPCLVAIVNNESGGKTYNNVGGVSAPIKGIPVPELVNGTQLFLMDEPDMEVFNSLPEWMRDDMKANLEYQGSPLQAALEGTSPSKADDTAVSQDDGVTLDSALPL